MRGAAVHDYPRLKLVINRLANFVIRVLFRHGYNDTTNAFKAYRREVIETVQPLLSNHFNLTVELPLKAIVRGHSYAIVPISWRNRKAGVEALDAGDGQPLPVHRPLRAARAPSEPRRLPPAARSLGRRGSALERGAIHGGARPPDLTFFAAGRRSENFAVVALGLLMALAAVVLYRKGLGLTFYYDEWSIVMERRGWDLDTLLEPHNEHIAFLPILVFKLLFVTVGLDDYWAYRVVAIAVHLVSGARLALCERVSAPGASVARRSSSSSARPGRTSSGRFRSAHCGFGRSRPWMPSVSRGADRAGDVTAAVLLAVSLACSSIAAPARPPPRWRSSPARAAS